MIGRKDDDGKIWAATVLAGFWHLARYPFRDVLACDDDVSVVMWMRVLDTYFDVDLPIDDRLYAAADLLRNDPAAIRAACVVGSYGARKYDRDNWLHVPGGINRYYEAGGRHVLDMLCGEAIDAVSRGGSGLPNWYHVAWNIFAGATLAARAKVEK